MSSAPPSPGIQRSPSRPGPPSVGWHRAFAIRLSLWYALVFLASSSILFGALYWLLASTLEAREQTLIQRKLDEYSAAYHQRGERGLRDAVARDSIAPEQVSLFVRLVSSRNDVTFAKVPDGWVGSRPVQIPLPGGLGTLEGKQRFIRVPRDAERDLAIASRVLGDGSVLEVGRTVLDPPTTLVRVTWADPSRIGWPLAKDAKRREPQRRSQRRDRRASTRAVS